MTDSCPICTNPKPPGATSSCTRSYCQEASYFYLTARLARKNSRKQREAKERADKCRELALRHYLPGRHEGIAAG